MPSTFHLTRASANKKLGSSVAASTSSKDTCPSLCPHKIDGSCYAMKGPQSWHWAKVSSGERGSNWWDFCQSVLKLKTKQLFRLNVSGDLPTNEDGLINKDKLSTLVQACELQELRGWTYTHHHLTNDENLKIINDNRSKHLTINLSCENRYEAAKYHQAGFQVSLIDDDLFDLLSNGYDVRHGNSRYFACPEQHPEMDGVTCSDCKACISNSPKRAIVVFKKH